MPPIVIAAGITAVAGTAVSVISGNKAADASQKATDKAIAAQKSAEARAIQRTEPFRQAGLGALGKLTNIFVNGGASDVMDLPGVQFLQQQGEQGLNRANAARGNFLSGAAMKEGIRFSEGLAATSYNDEYNRLYGIASMGGNAAAGQGNTITSTGNNTSNLVMANGQMQANQAINVGSSINTGFQNIFTSALMGGVFDKAPNGQAGDYARNNPSGAFANWDGGI